MASFQDSIDQMLWPEKRDKDPVFGDKIPGVIDRTTVTSWLRIPTGYLPDAIKHAQAVLNLAVPVFDEKGIEIGPIPAGTPVDLLANFDPLPEEPELAAAPGARQEGGRRRLSSWSTICGRCQRTPATSRPARSSPMSASSCSRSASARTSSSTAATISGRPWLRSDADKNALIAFLKTF